MGILSVLFLIFFLAWIFAPVIKRWLFARIVNKMNKQFSEQFGQQTGDNKQRNGGFNSDQTEASSQQKQDLKEIDNKRFDKSEGEYVDFEEVK
ncbi:MAG: DUF4834 family protein [Porphyromonadaceae bacterium]|nr:DUF4834 family protein [Porphyromonadaceae bacterium]